VLTCHGMGGVYGVLLDAIIAKWSGKRPSEKQPAAVCSSRKASKSVEFEGPRKPLLYNTRSSSPVRQTEMVMGLRDQMRLYGIKSRAGLARQNESAAEHYQIIELATAARKKRWPICSGGISGRGNRSSARPCRGWGARASRSSPVAVMAGNSRTKLKQSQGTPWGSHESLAVARAMRRQASPSSTAEVA
jgi:hypothetical protein